MLFLIVFTHSCVRFHCKMTSMKLLLYIFIGSSLKGTNANNLTRHLFKDYEPSMRPHCESSPVNITMDLALRQIIELVEIQQTLMVNVWLRFRWNDCRLRWDPSQYDGQDVLVVHEEKVWIPDIVLYDSVSLEMRSERDVRVKIKSNGNIAFNFPSITETRCKLDVASFPFDEQICRMTFGSWIYDGGEIDIHHKHPHGDLSITSTHVEWGIHDFKAKRHAITYDCCPHPYIDVSYYLRIHRKPGFYVLNLLFPSLLITSMTCLSFVIPIESGEKISFNITLMLALAVFQLMLAEILPHSADTMPIIELFFAVCISLVGLSVASASIVLRLYHSGEKPMPKWVRKLFLGKLSKVTCSNTKQKQSLEKIIFLELTQNKKEDKNSTPQAPQENSLPNTSNASLSEDWQKLAVIFEKLTAIIFVPTLMISTCVFFIIMRYQPSLNQDI